MSGYILHLCKSKSRVSFIASIAPEVPDCDTYEAEVDATVTAMQPQYEFN